MANVKNIDNVYESKPYQNLRQVIENALKQASVSTTKKIRVIMHTQTKDIQFVLPADATMDEALNIWAKAANAPYCEKRQNKR